MNKAKPKFMGFIVLLVIAIGLAVGGVVFKVNHQKGWPIKVESRITLTQTYDDSGRYNMGGRIKNVSNKTIVFTEDSFELTYSAPNNGSKTFNFGGYNSYELEYYFGTTELKPGEVLDLSKMPTLDDEILVINTTLKSFTLTIDGETYNLTSGASTSFILFITAGVVAVIALFALFTAINKAKSQDKTVEFAASQVPNSMVVSGTLTQKKDALKNLGKNVASIMGGAVSTAFLGVGAYKVYSTGISCYFILGEDKLYAFNQMNKNLSKENALTLDGSVLPETQIVAKNNKVTLKTADKTISIVINTKNSGHTADEVSARLSQIFSATATTTVDGVDAE